MLKKIIFSLCCMGLIQVTYAQGEGPFNYSAMDINEGLKKEAHSVCRLNENIIEVSSPSQYRQKVHQIVTILDKAGAYNLEKNLWFNKFRKFSDIDIRLFDKTGREIRKFTKKDFETYYAFDGISLVTDDKYMHLHIPLQEFPCTVETRYELNVSGYIQLPGANISNNEQSTEIFRYVAVIPNSIDIRYRVRNFEIKPEIQSDNKNKTYTWEAKNINAISIDVNSFEHDKYIPTIEIVPSAFEYDGYKGGFTSWKEFGKWNYDLYESKDPFNEQRLSEIKALIPSKSSDLDKIRILYDYLKKTTRYVSIQLGIGGFKPFPVKFVDENKYGDCKALTNYMRNLLKVAGIKSYPALINSGYRSFPADPSFPLDVFDHVILCIPREKDSVWLECTSDHNTAGFLGSFTENKNALLLTENGGVLVPTPRSNYKNNQLSTKTDIILDAEGGAHAVSSIYATGDIDGLFYEVNKEDTDTQKEIYVHYFNYKEPDEFVLKEKEQTGIGTTYHFELSYDKIYDFNAGNKYFLPQRIYQLSNEKINPSYSRRNEYLFRYPYEKTDTTIFHLPEKFSTDNIPSPVELNNDIGYYKKQIVINKEARSLTIITQLNLKKSIISANDYSKIAEFYASVQKNEDQKIVVLSNDRAVAQN